MDAAFFHILFPLFLLILGGFLISRFFDISEGPLIRIVTDFFMPLLVFHSFCTTPTHIAEILNVFGAVTLVVGVLFFITLLYCRLTRMNFKAVAPPILFMNSGFLGIPVMKLWGGLAAMNLIVLYDQLQTFYIFTLGIVIVTGSLNLSGLREMVRTPLIWSIVLGMAANLASIPVPGIILDGMKFGGDAAPALAIFSIGMSLNRYRVSFNRHVLVAVTIRFVLGWVLGWLAAAVFGFVGSQRTIIIVASALPSAVFSVVLPLRYGIGGKFAASVLVITTLLSLVTLPIAFYLCRL